MEWYTDYRFLGLAILLMGSMVTNIAAISVAKGNKKTSHKIMTNDLVHIARSIGGLTRKMSQIWKVVNAISDKQIKRDTLCNERHPVK